MSHDDLHGGSDAHGGNDLRGGDEIRSRLHGIPGPRAALDTDAVIAGARKRRRPKTIALSSAATLAGVLIIAPMVVPGLQQLQPTGGSVMVDSGAAPEVAPESGNGAPASGADSGGEEHAQSAGPGDQGAAGEPMEPLCGLPRAESLGLTLAFLAAPTEDSAVAWLRITDPPTGVTAQRSVRMVDIGTFDVDGTLVRVAAGAGEEQLTLVGTDWVQVEATTAVLDADACGDGTPSGPTPVAIVDVSEGDPVAVAGEPFDVR